MSTTAQSTPGATSASTLSSSSSHADSDTATLYLFTFLATILILVLLSASLVLRSYILRRRYRQRFQEALADSLFADLDRYPRSTRRVGPKPVVWGTWIHPADKDAAWSSLTPVAVRCSPLLSPPSSLVSSPQPSPPSRTHIFSQLRIPSPFTLSPRPSPPRSQSPIGSPPSRSPPPLAPAPPDTSTLPEKDAATLAVCVLVALPDAAAPVYRPTSDTKGKRVGPPASPAHPHTGDADPLLPSSRRQSRPPIVLERERLPLLEFGIAEVTTGEWVWKP